MANLVHFRIGEGAGKLLMEIAQDHLFYTLDPIKAVKTIEDSLSGCPYELVIKILKGDMVITVVTENDEEFFNVCNRDENIHSEYPVLDIVEWYKRKYKEIGDNGGYLHSALGEISEKLYKNDKNLTIDINLDSILRFLNGDDKAITNAVHDNHEVQEIHDVIKLCNDYLIQTRKVWNVMDFLINTYPSYFDACSNTADTWLDKGKHVVVDKFSYRLRSFIASNIELINKEINDVDDELKEFIKDSIVVDEVMSTGIVPVNIMDDYSAGWLAPNGDFYGLNGAMANMLHNQIADALFDAGIIVKSDDTHGNPDSWLSQKGWIRIHGNNVQFEGNLNHRISLHDVKMTDIQIKKLYEYGQLCCNGILSVGWRREKISATRFRDLIEMNYDKIIEQYFDF